jgi:two-component system chemotaxis sensor kinase CheA/chemotaxis protein CheC
MRVDIDSLEEFNLLARDGAQEASDALSAMTGTDAAIDITKITVVNRDDLVSELQYGSYECVQFDVEGELSGTVLFSFGPGSVDALADSLVPASADDALARNSLEELGNVMAGGFLTGWGDHLGTGLDMSPPTYVEHPDAETLDFGSTGPETDSVLVFQSAITWDQQVADIDVYLSPDQGSLERVVGESAGASGDSTLLALDKLSVFSDLTREGTETAARRVTTMAGTETVADVAGISFTPIDDIAGHLDGPFVGTTVEFSGTPSGFLVILFDEASAKNIADAMLPTDEGTEEFTDMHRSAIQELGNVMTSGFIDGWANVLQTSVDHTPPEFVDDVEMALLELVTEQLGPFQTHGFVIESTMRTDDIDFRCEILAIPNEEELSTALDELLVERASETTADPNGLF